VRGKYGPPPDVFSEVAKPGGSMPTYNSAIDPTGASLDAVVSRMNKHFGIKIERSEVNTKTNYNQLISMIRDQLPKE
jgi:hypothetical protein